MEPEPTTLAERFRFFVPAFHAGPAPLYAHLATCAAADLELPASPFREALEPFADEPVGRFLPLRLLAVVHRWALAGELPELAAHYPSAGGKRPPGGSWLAFRAAVIERADALPELLAPPLQHNEVTRAAALAAGFLLLSATTGLPMRVLEVGASAGLLLRWDHYLRCWWFRHLFDSAPPVLDGAVQVVERRGCDPHPIDALTAAGALTLRSFVWADLVDHVRILDQAITISRGVPAPVDQADGADWLEDHARPRRGVLTVVFHSLMRASGPPASLDRMEAALVRAASEARPDAPLAHLRFEAPTEAAPPRERGLAELRLTQWPGGEDRLLATADVNGRHVRWLA
jgi:hypothetical protein